MYPGRRNVAAQVTEELKTVTYATHMEGRRRRRRRRRSYPWMILIFLRPVVFFHRRRRAYLLRCELVLPEETPTNSKWQGVFGAGWFISFCDRLASGWSFTVLTAELCRALTTVEAESVPLSKPVSHQYPSDVVQLHIWTNACALNETDIVVQLHLIWMLLCKHVFCLS